MRLPDLKGRRALVSGSSQGIGRATCVRLLDEGAEVFGLSRDDESAAVSSLYHPICCDLSCSSQIDMVFESVNQLSPSLDYVVNVAGIDPKYSLAEGSEAEWNKVLDLNLRGYYLVIRKAVPLLLKGKGRSIVNVSSINYRLGIPKRSIYSVSKAGILGLTRGLARELGALGIRINSVSPGWVFTERQVKEYFTSEEDRRKYLPYLEEHQSIKRQISPEDVANHILFYLSEASAASTGHNCIVDAGWTLE